MRGDGVYIVVHNTSYRALRSPYFAIETDLLGTSIPINELQIEVKTADRIASGQYVYFYDDLNRLWAKYWIVYAEHIDRQWLLIRAQSDIRMIDGVTLNAVMYHDEPITDVLDQTMVMQNTAGSVVRYIDYALDSSLEAATITGYFPQQSARERLAQVCFVIGAYVKSYFCDGIEIKALDTSTALVPLSDTYWKPNLTYRDLVTAVRVKAYSFAIGTPTTTDEYVEANGATYIVTPQDFQLSNPDTTSDDPDNVVAVDKVMIINGDNASAVLARLAEYNFNRGELQLDIIDNASYIPGDMVTAYVDETTLMTGYIESCSFRFGVQARATIKMTELELVDGATLVIEYRADGVQIGRSEHYMPVGYAYSIATAYVDMTVPGHRYIYRPDVAAVTGTMPDDDMTVTVPCFVALDLDDEGVLHVISVDSVTEISETVDEETVTLGVIA